VSRTQAATCITVVVGLSAALINYWSLQEVAVASRIDWRLAYLYPLTIDGLGLAGLVAVDTLKGWRCFYAWCVVVVAFVLSLAGGAAHSMVDHGALELPAWGRACASAVAGLSAFGTIHLLVLIHGHERRTRAARPTRPEPQPEPPRARLTLVGDVGRVSQIRAALARGERLSGGKVAAKYGVSRATGGRLLREAREAAG